VFFRTRHLYRGVPSPIRKPQSPIGITDSDRQFILKPITESCIIEGTSIIRKVENKVNDFEITGSPAFVMLDNAENSFC
jgi:NifB/MoaA-like Fe-S oxidoreductase